MGGKIDQTKAPIEFIVPSESVYEYNRTSRHNKYTSLKERDKIVRKLQKQIPPIA